MKSKFIKLVSSLLVFSFLVAGFSVFSFAENTDGGNLTEEEVNLDNLQIFTNRTFEDGWDAGNGFTTFTPNGNNVVIDYEEDLLGNYNYFTRFEAAGDKASTVRVDFGALAVTHSLKNDTKATIIEFSIKADDLANLGNILNMTTTGEGSLIKMLDIDKEGNLIVFSDNKSYALNLGQLGNSWINLGFVFNWLDDDLNCTLHLGYGLGNGYSEEIVFDIPYPVAGDMGMKTITFTIPALATRSVNDKTKTVGMSFCIDNLKIYHGVPGIIELDPTEYGKNVDTGEQKVIDIIEGSHVKTKDQVLEETLAMKVGVDYALLRNTKYSLVNNSESAMYNDAYGAPVKIGDDIFVPLKLIIDYIGFPSYPHPDNMSYDITTGTSTTYITVGRDSATVDGKRVDLTTAPGYIKNSAGDEYLVAALADIPLIFPGWLTFYDDMGLIVIYEDVTPNDLTDNTPILSREENLDTMVNIMKKFVFDTVVGTEAEEGYIANGEKVYGDVEKNTDSFAHPYLIADSDTFKNLAAKYALEEGSEGYDKLLKSYIQAIVNKADNIYASYAQRDGSVYIGIKVESVPGQPATSDGYNSKGEMSELVDHTNALVNLAFAYQVTGEKNYALLAYDIALALSSWEHWGPAYATHFAQATASYALAYDWLYNAYTALDLNTEVLAAAIYKLGVHHGYVSSAGKACEYGRANAADLSVYNTSKDSVNAVGSSNMIIAALAILDYVDFENAPENAYYETMYLLGNNIQSLVQYGLDIYGPDGAYIESPVHWETATSSFFRMVMALESATGDDYGFMDSWGVNRTCYYAIHVENSDGYIWNYHDSTEYYTLNTDMFFFVGAYYGDENLIAVRQQQLSKGRGVTVFDLLAYPMDGVTKAPELELDYWMESIDGFVARSDWNSGAVYTGLMGGSNAATNGQLDSGNFIYQNKGIAWIADLGTENPYVQGISDSATRYKFYRNSTEGQNVIIKLNDTKVPYGQNTNVGGVITKTYNNEFGSFAILDNTEVYRNNVTSSGNSNISYAKRGVLLTNDRSTVVLQDELGFVYNGSLAWVVHTKANISLDDTGRVAYLTSSGADGKTYTVRASLLSKNPYFQFRIESANTPLLSGTSTGVTTGEKEYTRDAYSKLVIEATNVTLFEIAVVFELVENTKDETPVAYSWINMVDWMPSEYDADKYTETTNSRTTPEKDDIVDFAEEASNYLRRDAAYTKKLEDLYRALTNIGYLLKVHPYSSLTDRAHIVAYGDYSDCAEEYEAFMEYVNKNSTALADISLLLSGMKLAEDDAEAED